MNILLTVVIATLCVVIVWFGITAIIKIWRPSVEIGEFVDDKDGSHGKRAQAIIDFILREAPEIHRKADLSAISVGQGLKVPMVRRDPGLEQIETLDIKIKDIHLNWAIGLFRTLSKPSCEVTGRLLVGKTTTEMVLDLTDPAIRSTPILVSIPRTADESSDTEKAATEAAYELLYDIYRHFAKDKSRVPGNWISLQRFTEGLKELQEYRLAARWADTGSGKIAQAHLTTAIEKLEQVKQIDPSYNDGLYYLGVAYFEQHSIEKDPKEVFEELLKREPSAPQSLEARFYLGYAWFRTYKEPGLTNALTQYAKLEADLESRAQDSTLPSAERKRARGLLAETYAQMATVNAHLLLRLRGPECDRNRSVSNEDLHSANQYLEATEKYAKKALQYTGSSYEISPEILQDVKWRRLNALGIAEKNYACFEQDKYKDHCEKALDYYDQALQSSPLNFNILENKGEIYRDALSPVHNLGEAKALFLQAEGLKPTDYYAPQQLGLIYEALWKNAANADDKEKMSEYYQKMIEYCHKATELGSASAAHQLGMVYEALWKKSRRANDKKNMIEYYQKAIQLGSSRAKSRLEELHVPVKAKA